jgi:hypothetical protein
MYKFPLDAENLSMIAFGSARRSRWLAAVLLLSSGCGVGQGGHTADADQAQETLRIVLDAWKAGETPESLEKRTPAIHVKDADWLEGFRLLSYAPGGEGKLVGFDMNYTVILELKSPKGKAVKRNAVYTITTRPELLVMRQEG